MSSISKLKSALNNVSPLSEGDIEFLAKNSKTQEFIKGEFLIKEGQIARYIGFVTKGVFRVYQNIDGKEVTSYFSYEERNPFATSFVSFLTELPSVEYVEAIEDASVILLSKESINELYNSSKSFERLGRIMSEKNYLLATERIRSLQYQTASDRYNMFMEIYPSLLNRIPHHYIASYLGITPESLSRVRKEISSK